MEPRASLLDHVNKFAANLALWTPSWTVIERTRPWPFGHTAVYDPARLL